DFFGSFKKEKTTSFECCWRKGSLKVEIVRGEVAFKLLLRVRIVKLNLFGVHNSLHCAFCRKQLPFMILSVAQPDFYLSRIYGCLIRKHEFYPEWQDTAGREIGLKELLALFVRQERC